MKLCKHCTPRRLSKKTKENGYYVHSLPCDYCDGFGKALTGKAAIIASLDSFTRHYIIAGLWSCPLSYDGDDRSIDTRYGIEDVTVTALLRCISDCKRFQEENARALSLANYREGYYSDGERYKKAELAGHDFWLTRNRHGAGFWDRGLRLCLGRILTNAAQAFGEVSFYAQGGKVGLE